MKFIALLLALISTSSFALDLIHASCPSHVDCEVKSDVSVPKKAKSFGKSAKLKNKTVRTTVAINQNVKALYIKAIDASVSIHDIDVKIAGESPDMDVDYFIIRKGKAVKITFDGSAHKVSRISIEAVRTLYWGSEPTLEIFAE